jgi:hypothetical protein
LDKFTGSEYAAKFIHVCDEHQKRFFRTEVNTLRWLNQRGVPKVVDTFITDRRIVIITEMYPLKIPSVINSTVKMYKWSENQIF